MNRNISKNNIGYSLVELVIVLAIIAILAAMALVSVTIIHSARAKDSAVKFNSEVAELLTKSKNMKLVDDTDSTQMNSYALVMCKEEVDGIDKIIIYPAEYNIKTGDYILDDTKNMYITLPANVNVSFDGVNYKPGLTNTKSSKYNGNEDFIQKDSDDWVYIRFDNKGTCLSGYGTYRFYKKNGNVVSRVTIRQNGSHELK